MAWLTAEDLVAAFGEAEVRQLADRDRDGMPDAAVVEPALARAEEEIGALMRRRYPGFPTPVVPELAKRAALDVARYYLHDKVVPEIVRDRYADALRMAREAVFTDAQLGVDRYFAPAAAPSIVSGVRVPVFNRAFRTLYDGAGEASRQYIGPAHGERL